MIRPADPISPELNELEKFTLEQRAKINATSPRQAAIKSYIAIGCAIASIVLRILLAVK